MVERIRFERPPVVEVVCGVLFGSLPGLRTAHVGVFWDAIRKEFPLVEEAPPLSPVIETSDRSPMLEAELLLIPPLPRTWFSTADGHGLVQLQRDRFVYNWKRGSPDDGNYPSYDVVIVNFERLWREFGSFVSREQLGELVARQFELVYVNVVPMSSIPSRDPVLVDHTRKLSPDRFLPDPESYAWRTSYLLPDDRGRLHVAASSARAIETGDPILKLDITARGIGNAATDEMRDWFDMAHEWIVRGFADVTTESMQRNVWGRKA
jgi:uncharacterized protein (TIGR04255 family)